MLVKWNKMSVMEIFFYYYTHSIIRVTVFHRVTLVSLSKKYTSNTYLAQEMLFASYVDMVVFLLYHTVY